MRLDIKVLNLGEVKSKFRLLTGRFAARMEAITKEAGFLIERGAKQRVPVRTGRLRSSITTVSMGRGLSTVVVVGTNVSYARAVEFGVPGRSRPQPYLIPAFEEVKGRFLGKLEAALKEVTK